MRLLTTAHETLERAAHVIEQRGWIQNEERNANGICLVEALRIAADASIVRFDVLVHYTAAAVFLTGKAARAPYKTIMHWNDENGRTQEDVTAALRQGAAFARKAYYDGQREPVGADVKRTAEQATGSHAVARW